MSSSRANLWRTPIAAPLLFSIIAGFAVTVAVAWLISIRTWHSNYRPAIVEFVNAEQRLKGDIERLPGFAICTATVYGQHVWEFVKESGSQSGATAPTWATVPTPPEDLAFTRTLAAGWPRLALVCVYADNRSYGRGSWRLSVRGQEYMLPARPYWPGLLTNSGLYAGAIFAVLMALRFGRRWFRHRRGRCFRCGYSLDHLPSSVCPECGAGRVPSSTHAPRLPPPKPFH